MRQCPKCGSEYPDDANFCPMDASQLPPASAQAPAAATMIDMPAIRTIGGRFFVMGAVSRSATGKVVGAKDTQTHAMVTLKWVDPALLQTAPLAERTLRELKQMAQVNSERVVRVIDAGRDEEGQLYVATAVPKGETLAEWVGKHGAQPWAFVKQLARDVGAGLAEGQKVGVVHRDVCPANIWVQPDGHAQLADFALAEAITDNVFGNPAFIAPEQAEGKSVDPRSNVYSLAAIVYYAATGTPLFAGDAPTILQQQAHATPPSIRAAHPELSVALERAIMKALEKSSSRRHLSLAQFLGEIEQADPAPVAPPNATMVGVAPFSPGDGQTSEHPVGHSETMPAEIVQTPANGIPATAATPAPAAQFRETGWFKRGEIEQELARREAAVATADPLAPSGATGSHSSLTEKQIAEQLSVAERKRLSLKTGQTQTMKAIKAPAAESLGERMSEDDVLAEMDGGKKWVLIGGIVAVIVIGAVVFLALK